MKKIVYSAVTLLVVAGLLLAEEKAAARKTSKADAALARLKALAGEWEAKSDDGTKVQATYRVISANSCVMETLNFEGHEDMVTIYHLDGDRIMLTHYCAANNQPRMRAEPPSGDVNKLSFRFLDVTNLAGPAEGHMHDLEVTFTDADHFTQEWTSFNEGKAGGTVKFSYQRKKP